MKKGYGFAVVLGVCLVFGPVVTGTELKFATQEFAPYNYEIDGVVSGPLADIISEVCKEMKTSCSFKSLPWARAQMHVKKGQMQGLFVIAWNEKRSKWLSFSPPVLNAEYGFFVRDDNPLELRQLSDIKGYSVGVYGPSNTAESLKKIKDEIKDIVIDMTPHDEAPFKKLSFGRIDAVYSNRDVGYFLIKGLGMKNIRYVGAHKKINYYIAFSKEFTDRKIVEQFNAIFLDLHKRGVIRKILDKYSLEPAQIE